MKTQIVYFFFVGIHHVSMLNKKLACCELHANSLIIAMILSKYFFTIIQHNKGWRVGVGGCIILNTEDSKTNGRRKARVA